jgi:hypothetical protein
MFKSNCSRPLTTVIGGLLLCLSPYSGGITDLGLVTVVGHYDNNFALLSEYI